MSDSGQPNVRLLVTIAVIVAVAVCAVTISVLLLGRSADTADRTARPQPGISAGGSASPAGPPAARPAARAGFVHEHEDGSLHTHREGAPDSWTVTYSGDGTFTPERLDMLTGDEVVFVNDARIPVWPASNIHPTHEILSSFDPLEAIAPGESWTYTFVENGYWRYHNHIDPSETGLVVSTGGPDDVLNPLEVKLPELRFAAVPAGADGNALFDDIDALTAFVETHGPAATVNVLKQTELTEGRYCHDAAHEAGRLAYETFGPAAFVLSGHECQAGALHGSIEALFADRGTSRLAKDISAVCATAANPFLAHQCYHGVGHGLMAWTTYEIHEALELCDVIGDEQNRASCQSGVFMENVVGGLSGLMGHRTEYLRPDDPRYPCDVVAADYVDDCYAYQTTHMLAVFGGDFAAVAAICAELPGSARTLCFYSYGRDVGNATRGDPARAVGLCGYAPAGPDYAECITGTAQDRFWETTGAAEAIVVCSLVEAPDVAEACWWTIIERAGDVFFDEAGRRSFCDRLPDIWRRNCYSVILR